MVWEVRKSPRPPLMDQGGIWTETYGFELEPVVMASRVVVIGPRLHECAIFQLLLGRA